MKRILTPLFILALAVPLRSEEPKTVPIETAKIAPRCQVDKLEALFKESNPMAKEDLKGFVTTGNALRVPENKEGVDLGKAPAGNPLCTDAVWRYLLRDDKKLRAAPLQDQIRMIQAANTAFQQVDELADKVAAEAAQVYAQAAAMDIVAVKPNKVQFEYRAPADVLDVSAKEPRPAMDPDEYERALLSIVRPKAEGSDVLVPGATIQTFYSSLLALRSKMKELRIAEYEDDPGLKEQFKTPEIMHRVMRYVADCDFGRDDVEKGKKLSCWGDKDTYRKQSLGFMDRFTRNVIGSHLAQSTFIYARAVALVEKVGPNGKKRTIRELLKEIDRLKEENRVQKRNMRLLDFNQQVFQNLGKGVFGDKQGIDDLRAAWAGKGEAWQKAHPEVKQAIDAVDGMQGAQFTGGTLIFKDKDREVLYGRDIDLLTVKPEEMNAVSGQVADSLMKGNKWGAIFQAAKAAVFGAPKEEPKKEEPKKDQPKKDQPKKDQPKKEEPKKDQPKKNQPKKDQTKKEESKKEEPVVIPQLPAPAKIGFWEKMGMDPMEQVRLGYQRALSGSAADDARKRMAADEQRKAALQSAKSSYESELYDADNNSFLSKEAAAQKKIDAEKAWKKAQEDDKKAQEELKKQAAKDAVIQKAWSEQANQKLAAAYNEALLKLIPGLAQTYKVGGWRHEGLAAETASGKYLNDDIVQEYFDKGWLGDASKDPVKSNLLACQKAHGFNPTPGAVTAAYASPLEWTVEQKCVRADLGGYINGQKGKRSR